MFVLRVKSEVRDKIWWGDYVDIFALFPLENLVRIKPEESKKEDEDKHRHRLIPWTFSNWLQAIAIFASVIGEKNHLRTVPPFFVILMPLARPRGCTGTWPGCIMMNSLVSVRLFIPLYVGIIRTSVSG